MGKTTKILIAIILLLLIVAGAVANLLISGDEMQPNISINNIDISRLTKEEAEAKVRKVMGEEFAKLELSVKFQEKEWKLNYEDIELHYDVENVIEEAYSIGRQGNFFKRLTTVIDSQFNSHELSLNYTYNEQKVHELVEEIAKEIDQEAVEATISYKKPDFVVTQDKPGRTVNKDKTIEAIKAELDKRVSAVIELPVYIVEASIRKSDLENIKDVIGEFSTKFNAADVDRTHNIKVATSSASHILLHPGEIYSVNQVVGPRLAKYGFKEAKVIINNELVPGIGGGVCQVSTTLYNAALLANLKIVERRNHTLPLSYAPVGRDATISGDYIDFKFKNSTPYPIYIYGEVSGSWVKFSIFGKNDYPNRAVRIETETVKVTEPVITTIPDSTLLEGTEVEEKKAYTGYVVKSYRVIIENGVAIFKEPLFTDTYKVVDGVMRVGTKPKPKPDSNVITENSSDANQEEEETQ